MQYLTYLDAIWFVILVLGFRLWAKAVQAKYIHTKPEYKYFARAMDFRIFSVLFFMLIYLFYYGGGDTVEYWKGVVATKNLFFYDIKAYLRVLTGEVNNRLNYENFNEATGYPPPHLFRRAANFNVVRIGSLPGIITGGSIIAINLFFMFFSFLATWKIFQVFIHYFPHRRNILNYTILLFPSTAFWGSGLMKDTLCYIGLCYLFYGLFQQFVKKENGPLLNWPMIILGGLTVFSIKTYIVIAFLPGVLIWLNFELVRKIKSPLIKIVVLPALLIGSFAGGLNLYMSSSDALGEYSSGQIFQQAATIQQDLAREEQYGGNKFDIGTFDPSLSGVLKKFPVAVFAGLYRPMIFEASNIVMILSGIENTILLLMTVIMFIKLNPIGFILRLGSRPLYIMSLVYSILFSFAVGLTSANFGALVRYKIQILPFFVSMLALMWVDKGIKNEPNFVNFKEEDKEKKEEKEEDLSYLHPVIQEQIRAQKAKKLNQ
jgi:hypothetical protein